jgi:hypothetical protein
LSIVPKADLYFLPIAPLQIIEMGMVVYQAPGVNGAVGVALQARIL